MPTPTNENSRDYRHALGRFATGITVVTTEVETIIHGMTCNAFLSISLTPPLIGISVTHKARMLGFLEQSGRFGVSILSDAQEHISSHFAGQHQADLEDPFIEINNMAMIKAANAHLIADVVEQVVLGDHTLFVGQVTYFNYQADGDPLIYSKGRYAKVAS